MIIKVHQFLSRLVSVSQFRSVHKHIYKMNKAYVRHLPEAEQFQLTFHFVNSELKVDRAFNFCRKLTESVDSLFTRLSVNLEKSVNKKNKKKKVLETEANSTPLLNLSLILNNQEVSREQVCGDIFQTGNSVTLNVLNTAYDVVINSPWVDSINLPNTMLANFPVYSSKLETTFTNDAESIFSWYRTQNGKDWSEVGDGLIYYPSNDDIGCFLKLICTPKNGPLEGPSSEVISKQAVTAGPGPCPFEIRHQFTKERTAGKTLRVVTYNILADLYCDMEYTREVLHPYCPPYALELDYRKQLYLKELLGYNADIICLQEVDRKVFKHDLTKVFNRFNYEGDFSLKGGDVAEGLAFFYNKNRFNKLDSKRIVFSEIMNTDPLYADIWEKISENEKLSERILERTTTLQVNVIKSKEFDEILIVANIHLYFHPDADHIRLLQGGLAIRYLENLLKTLKEENVGKRCSLVFCGDFNSVPECGVYKLYTSGHVPSDYIDFQSNQEQSINTVELKQSLLLDSACGTPKYTNYTTGFADCLDYIFYEKDKMEVVQVVPLPSIEEITQHIALPSVIFPSDHIALVSDLRWL